LAKLQTSIARALDDGEFAMVACLDLSAFFDIVNINHLIKDLKSKAYQMM
jgi:hypothetical protein